MRRFWKNGQVLSLKLPDGSYTVAQMVDELSMMTFFDVFNSNDEWQGIDLNTEKKLFTISTFGVVKFLGERRIKEKEITPLKDTRFCQDTIIPYLNDMDKFRAGEFHLKGGRLSSFDEESNSEIMIKEHLNVKDDRDDILNHEFDSLASPVEVETRLLFYKTFGEDFHYFKHRIFPGLYSDELVHKYEELSKEFDINF